jgi:shikimate dehydrogenase
MFVLFEEDGSFKVATLFSEADATIQVEMPTGKRSKIKRNTVLLMFATPGRDELLPQAHAIGAELDPQFLWECAPDDEFSFQDFAKEVFSASPSIPECAGVLLALHQAPMYFYRKGRGNYRRAPAESLQAALAGAERKRLAAEAQQAMHDALVAGRVPEEIQANALQLLIRPDKQSIAYKALESASSALQIHPGRMLLNHGALTSVYRLHRARFLQQCFPHGTGFGLTDADLQQAIDAAAKQALPLAPSPAYSIDDATTTEIDDAFSLTELDDGGWRVGIHIAAPGIGFAPDSPLGKAARERASTVYFPGDKITMLPQSVITAFSLDQGREQPALSLYVDFNAAGEKISSQSRLERVRIEQNLRLGDWEAMLDGPFEQIDAQALPWSGLKPLLGLARSLRSQREQARGKPEMSGRVDFNFYVDWNANNPDALEHGDGVPRIVERQRGSPIDVLVSEFMILANTSWGDLLALARLPGIYRVQTMGRVRMQTQPGPHQGLGVNNYAWSTSPLRRYSDLINQWQVLAVLGHRSPVFKGNEAELFSTVTHFDTLYNHYGEFQDTIERYWAQRWLGVRHGLGNDESWSAVKLGVSVREPAVALREGAFRLRRAPVVFRCPDAPILAPGAEVEVELLAADALDLSLQAKFGSVISQAAAGEALVNLSEHYAVLGHPIAHSKSPWIHHHFAQQTEQRLNYQAIEVTPAALASELERLVEAGFGGVNLTVPLKEEAFALAQGLDWEVSDRAMAANAINTLIFQANGFIAADNTDGIGLVRDLERLLGAAGALDDRRVLLIGAGGAAQGVIGPLRAAGVRHIRVANRNLEKAQAVVARWAAIDATSAQWLSAMPLSMLADPEQPPGDESGRQALDDIVINATSASLSGAAIAIHPSRFAAARLVVDMMYGPSLTAFLSQAKAAGAPLVADGLGMLVEQAAEAFYLWRGLRPETASVLAELRLQLAAN